MRHGYKPMTKTLRQTLAIAFVLYGCSSASSSDPTPPSQVGPSDASVAAGDASVTTDAGGGLDAADGAASGDADAADAAPVCKALFCEDFESGTLDTTRWEQDNGYDAANTVTVQAAKAGHGKYAARAHLATAGGFSFIRAKAPFPALANELWGRAYVFQTIDVTVGHNALVKIENAAASVLEIGQSQGKVQLTFYPPGGEAPAGYQTSIPRMAWTCMEWHMKQASPQIELFADGASLATYTYGGAATIPTFTSIKLGIETHVASPSAYDVYIDDVALDTARIGCLP